MAPAGVAQSASPFSSQADLSVLPVLGAGATQRDMREHASSDCEEFETICHPAGIEELNVQSAIPESLSNALGSLLDCDRRAVIPVQLETRGTTSQKSNTFQPELWARQTIHKNTVAAKLREAGRTDLSDTLESCHSEKTWAICTNCRTAKPFLNRCERFYCPECQPTLSRDRERSVGWWSREMTQPKHVVLTLQNTDELTKEYVLWAKMCFSRLRRRVFAKNWQGGFYNWEVTKEKAGSVKHGHVLAGGWHLHCHALVEARWIDELQLAEEWAKVTEGRGRIVKVMDARRVDYLKEVTKYAVKGSQLAAWTGAEIACFIDSFTGVRTFGVFGSLYGKRTEFKEWIAQLQDRALKCKCGCENFTYQSDFDYEHGELIPETAARPPTRAAASIAQLQFLSV